MKPRSLVDRGPAARRDDGTVLVIALCLLATLTVLAVASLGTGTLELVLAGNEQQRIQAFHAADAGLEQALAARVFDTDPAASAARFDDPAARDPRPRPGHGTPIAGCTAPADALPACEYFVRYDAAAGGTPLPGGVDPGPGRRAFHFVVESVGVAGRGARVELLQGLYVVATVDTPSDCVIGSAGCGLRDPDPPVRTFWRQRGVN